MKMGRCDSFNPSFYFSLILLIQLVQTINGLKFIVEPEDTIVPKGASVVLNCAARGDGQPRISWKKDGTQLTFVGDLRKSILANGSLHITSLLRTRETRPDEGLYQCVASLEGVGSILSRSAKLQAASLARFDEEPEDISVGIGQTARFSCSAQGIPQPSVAWLKDEAPLELEASRMIVLPSGSLEISQIRATDEGVYRCNLSNVDKAFISRSGRLVHNPNPERDTPPLFTAVPKSQTVMASKSVVLECSAVSYPKPTITWLKDGVTLDLRSSESRFSFIGEGNLKISKAEESDKGTYQCRAENREDSNDVSAALDIHVPPKASIIPTNFYAYEKEDIELPCKIYGKPTPTIQWVKNGNMILEGDYFQIVHGNNLKILGLVDTDAGMYQCFGTNPAGNVQSSVHLRVLKPGEEMPVSEVDEESELNLGQSLPSSRGNSGSSSSLSSAPREVSIMFVSTRFITLSWKPPTTTNGRILAYAIFYKESTSDRERVLNTTTKSSLEELNIPGLQPNKTYTFRVVPYNEKGAGASSKEISVTTSPELGVPGSPRNVKAWATSPTQAKVEWAPPENTNGGIQKYKVYFVEVQEEGSDVIPQVDKVLEDFEDFEEDDDDDDYFLSKSDGIQVVTVESTEAILDELRVYTEYFVWVVAVNEHGPSPNSDQVKILTLSDAPGDTPHNVSVESQSSTSLIVRWEPPPKEFINGVITGYKLKYKQKGKKKAETVTTDGNSRFFSLNDLERGAEFQVKIAALNVNGSGPSTEWINAATFHKDLDESQVPGEPASLQARAMSDSITISWSPPKNANTMVRGFTIGWGKGIPDVYTKLVDGKRRVFTIDKLRPNSEYVISLRAFNNVGDGVPVYENVRTRVTSEEEDEHMGPSMAQLPPPVGLRAIVLSPVSVVLSWMDTSLPKRQVVTDNRYYVVRYLPADELLRTASQRKAVMKLLNTTQLNVLIDDLKPGTPYEFSVKVVKNRHSSEWSLDALNTTFTPQHSPPQDLTLLAITGEDGTSSVILNWQPPVSTTNNDEMKGYLVFYTTNPSLKEWVEEPIPDDVLTHRVQGLTPETKYFFRMAAKHSKGFGPHTEIKSVETPAAKNNNRETAPVKPTSFGDYDEKSNQILLYVLIGLSLTFAFASVSLCIYYKKRGNEPTPKQTPIKKCRKPELKPPDLWIHHDQMELKSIEKGGMGQRSETPITPSTRGSREFGDPEEKMPLQQSTNSLDKRNFMSSYIAGDVSHSSHSLGRRKPKPIKIPVEPFFFQKDIGGGGELARNPTFSRNSQIQSQFRDVSDGHKTYESMQSGSSNASSQHNLAPNIQYSGTSDYGTTSGGSTLGTLGRRTGGNLKSFAVPIPPSTPHNKVNIRPTTSSSALPTGIPASPVKRISTSHLPPPSFPSLSPRSYGSEDPQLQKCYSTEELSQEISNLEGLMKDLNAITASEFQC